MKRWRIPNLFKKRSICTGTAPNLTNTWSVGAAHPPQVARR